MPHDTKLTNVTIFTNDAKCATLTSVNMNVANFPVDVAKRLRVMAAERGVKIRELVIEACRNLVDSGTLPLQKMSGDPSLQNRLVNEQLSTKKPLQTTASRKKSRALTESSAGSVTTGTEEQGIADESDVAKVDGAVPEAKVQVDVHRPARQSDRVGREKVRDDEPSGRASDSGRVEEVVPVDRCAHRMSSVCDDCMKVRKGLK